MAQINQKNLPAKELTIEQMAKALVSLAALANACGFVVMIGGSEPPKN